MIRKTTAVAVLLATLLALTACNDDGNAQDDGASPSPDTSSESPSEEQNPEDQAIDDATTAVKKLYEVENKLAQNADLPLSRLNKAASGQALSERKTILQELRDGGLTVQGNTTFKVDKVIDVSLSKAASVELQVCYDVTDVEVVDKNGDSAVSDGRLDKAIATYVVSNDEYKQKPSEAWIVTRSTDTGAQSC